MSNEAIDASSASFKVEESERKRKSNKKSEYVQE